MPRIRLRDDLTCLPLLSTGVILDDDLCVTTPTVMPVAERMSVYNREMLGRNENGDPIYDWVLVEDDVPIVLLHHRFEWVDGVTIAKLKVKSQLLDQSVSEKSALDLNLSDSTDPIQTRVFRVTSVEHTGTMTLIEAERQLDLSDGDTH